MRGDSLRDLYAKTLALLGLGVLAGAGALVDYWPIAVNVPEAGSALDLPALARPLPVSNQLSVRIVRESSPRSPRRVSLPNHGVAPVMAYTALPVAVVSESGLGEPVGLAAPVTRSAAATLTPTSFASSNAAIDSYELYLTLATSDAIQLPAPATTSASADSDGFLTGAFKKTGSSIVKTGVKTGASIYDAVRVVGGAVRKALPN